MSVAFDEVNETFAEWFELYQDVLNKWYRTVGAKFSETKMEAAQFYITYSDSVCDIKLDLHGFQLKANHFHTEWIATETEKLKEKDEKYVGMNDKTLFDLMKKQNCNEKRVADLLMVMIITLEHNTSQCQSKLKWMQK